MPRIAANDIDIEYDTFGQPDRPAVLLIMGLGMQLVAWPEDFCRALADAGFYVIRYDNRDVGLSTHMHHHGRPRLSWHMFRRAIGLPLRPRYTLDDMAADAIGLLDALQLRQAHLVGVSMGGMIAQIIATRWPERVLTLASIMSTSGAPGLPGPTPQAQTALLRRPPRAYYRPERRDDLVRFLQDTFHMLNSPGFPIDATLQRQRIRQGLDRALNPVGTLRQILAVAAAPDRSAALAGIRTPTLVVHGLDDPLLPVACGRDTAAKIPAARLVEVPGMAHDLSPGVCEQLLRHLVPHLRQARAA
ncbi:alpha/beta fold hydrolase [Chitiniphilus eburneus]|uniref:Alpha/beta fold hydrolase n=1 Tax=Chitiniphilus eburneus TaxID=2571148 RepID=A0A4U0PBQ1_9NEIS|nr:alpha/beta hydrolase [Chitiniphilus eburneus]TJZ64362.1 alpha/beta fold hydrolase [Chitiniphilus eburneus]